MKCFELWLCSPSILQLAGRSDELELTTEWTNSFSGFPYTSNFVPIVDISSYKSNGYACAPCPSTNICWTQISINLFICSNVGSSGPGTTMTRIVSSCSCWRLRGLLQQVIYNAPVECEPALIAWNLQHRKHKYSGIVQTHQSKLICHTNPHRNDTNCCIFFFTSTSSISHFPPFQRLKPAWIICQP